MNCSKGAIQLVDTIIATIDVISEDDFSKPMEIYNGSTFGKHFRHIYDFFFSIVDQHSAHEVDYCLRNRDAALECQKQCAIEKFSVLKAQLLEVDESTPITVYADFELENSVRPRVRSTLGRELMYAYDHAVHHLAIIKIGLKSIDPDAPIAEDLGVAASTIRHQHASGYVH